MELCTQQLERQTSKLPWRETWRSNTVSNISCIQRQQLKIPLLFIVRVHAGKVIKSSTKFTRRLIFPAIRSDIVSAFSRIFGWRGLVLFLHSTFYWSFYYILITGIKPIRAVVCYFVFFWLSCFLAIFQSRSFSFPSHLPFKILGQNSCSVSCLICPRPLLCF